MKNVVYGFLAAFLLFGGAPVSAQLNMTLTGQLDYNDGVNDIWGYVDTEGTEYALVGLETGFSIVSLKDPANPDEVVRIPGQETVWRDIKTWGEFAYVVSDNTSEGMLIVDLSQLPDTAAYVYITPDVPGRGQVRRAHNIYIDEYGLAYLAGANTGGLVVWDVKADPWNPTLIKWINTEYSHDVYVRDSIIYSSEVYHGELSIYDISDTSDVRYVGGTPTPSEFTHNAWLSDDSKSIFTTDERANGFVAAYDITDFGSIRELDRYKPAKTAGLGVIPHNVHVLDDYLVVSYYTDGCKVVDASRPDNLIEVGDYDTYLGGNGGFNGSWGAYPFLPSGAVLVSDRQTGLYVLEPNYVRGCYAHVTVIDDATEEPILNVEVSIDDQDEEVLPEFTNLDGLAKTGKAIPGDYLVRASHPEFRKKSVEATFENGVQTDITIRLERKPKYKVWGEVVSEQTQTGVPFANVYATDGTFTFVTQADSSGAYTLDDVYEGNYMVYAGVFEQYSINQLNLGGNLNRSYLVSAGYYDDFNFDYGWTVTGNSTGAHWVRDVPILETFFGFQCNPEFDVPDDLGDEAYMTGNMGGDAQDNSVENGYTLLSSPLIDMTGWSEPVVSFRSWLCIRFLDTESYFVMLSNGTDTVTLDTIKIDGNIGYWREATEIAIPDSLIDFTSEMQVHFLARNEVDGNMVKAALDLFQVFDDAEPSATIDVSPAVDVTVYPNPGTDRLHVDFGQADADQLPTGLIVYDMLGRVNMVRDWPRGESVATVEHQLQPGMYLIAMVDGSRTIATRKFVVEQ